jgi:alpha-beta hydrolase superfamily lysophospholipase
MRLERDADALCHSRMSAPLFFGMIAGGLHVARHAAEIRNPVLMILGGSDPITDPVASRDVFNLLGSPDKTLLLFPGMLHEPLNELGREQVYADLIAWLDHHLAAAPAAEHA